jgi:predicted amidohydrolase YtcJ
MDLKKPKAAAVAIEGDRILLVSGRNDLDPLTGAGTKVIDCGGRTVVPGFNDAHCHIYTLLRQLLSVDISPASVKSIEDIKTLLHQKARKTPPGKWITASGYSDFFIAEKRHPTRWDIDEAAPDNPVILLHRSLHACVLNSLALELAGINRETEERPGTAIERDMTSGEPNGLLFEMIGHINREVLPHLTEEEIIKGIVLADRHYLSQGITSLQDATEANNLVRWEQLTDIKNHGLLKSRLSMMFGAKELGKVREAGLYAGFGDSRLSLGGAKIILSDVTGEIFPPQDKINEMVFACHEAGFQVAIHAVTHETVEAAITALEYADSRLPAADARLRIEHCSECPPNLLERLRKLNAVVVTQPPFLHYSGERYIENVTEDRFPWLYRIKSLSDAGLVVAGSSDSPIVPDNPLVGIYSAVTRKSEAGRPVLPEERIPARQALAMYTINAAYAQFEESFKGSITPGKLADMVVLSANPLTSPRESIKDIKVEMTILGGEVVWEI